MRSLNGHSCSNIGDSNRFVFRRLYARCQLRRRHSTSQRPPAVDDLAWRTNLIADGLRKFTLLLGGLVGEAGGGDDLITGHRK